jgi:hypothetical protein
VAFSTPDIFLRHFLVFLSCERARNARNFQSNFFYLDYSVISAFILKCMFLIRLFPTDWRLITTWSNKLTSSVSVCQSLCTFISAGSKFAQLQCLWRTKDSNQVSALSWSLAIYTTLSECSCNTTQLNPNQACQLMSHMYIHCCSYHALYCWEKINKWYQYGKF